MNNNMNKKINNNNMNNINNKYNRQIVDIMNLCKIQTIAFQYFKITKMKKNLYYICVDMINKNIINI